MKFKLIVALVYILGMTELATTVSAKSNDRSLGVASPNSTYSKKVEKAQKKYKKSRTRRCKGCIK